MGSKNKRDLTLVETLMILSLVAIFAVPAACDAYLTKNDPRYGIAYGEEIQTQAAIHTWFKEEKMAKVALRTGVVNTKEPEEFGAEIRLDDLSLVRFPATEAKELWERYKGDATITIRYRQVYSKWWSPECGQQQEPTHKELVVIE